MELPDWAKEMQWIPELLKSCPRSGAGVHRWIFVTALKLHVYFPDKDELARLLKEATANCGREVDDREIDEAVYHSQTIAENPSSVPTIPRWPERDEAKIQEILKAGFNLARLEAASPVKATNTEDVIDILFPGDPLICAGPRKEQAFTRARSLWRGYMGNQQFIVPSPMSELYGRTKSGKRSMRTLSNVGPRRFLVVEFDQGEFDQHAALLGHLSQYAPLVMAVHSGNKSLHGWFFCANQVEEVILKFFRYAVSLGADYVTWTRCQFVRMPGGKRDNGNPQRILFFNPNLL